MKRSLSTKTIRRTMNAASAVLFSAFIAFSAYLYFANRDLLVGDVQVEEQRTLLTKFDTNKFDRAVERLEKRRGLADPAGLSEDRFGKTR
jgi:hypothetical protein